MDKHIRKLIESEVNRQTDKAYLSGKIAGAVEATEQCARGVDPLDVRSYLVDKYQEVIRVKPVQEGIGRPSKCE